LITAAPWMFDISSSCCVGFLRALKIYMCDRGDVMVRAGSLRRTMYILMKGEMKITWETDASKETIELYAPGARTGGSKVKDKATRKSKMDAVRGRMDKMGTLIGFQDCFKKMEPMMYTAVATNRCSLLAITRGQLKDLLTAYPDDKEHFDKAIEFANSTFENAAAGGLRRSGSDSAASKARGRLNADSVFSSTRKDDEKKVEEEKAAPFPPKPSTPNGKSAALEKIESEARQTELKEKTASGTAGVIPGVSTDEVADLRRKVDMLSKIYSEQFSMIEHQSAMLTNALQRKVAAANAANAANAPATATK